ncbi:MAM and LDL-receptor class A domain-containing protein 1-like isoform X4 [Cimex lectularius]|nr:MAM and LDL-receptor class A domain-containing protein 1-like isoform X4 [Cimex lectularius]XP_024085885.1 MAM and LDL-receptor class A domain-containing protein 1-like isoform X4 [Cimex lectularius]XP_024085886.1 MAM and LDL-receptor class A domain-containing protein 1-like isoform X4 [Cimex lectularius]XP_024085887.1 MAM and LDL-receptor class A domain-containing protein 1-like isoform X4 [Cimex lectularius]
MNSAFTGSFLAFLVIVTTIQQVDLTSLHTNITWHATTLPKIRIRRQDTSELCDFGTDTELGLCEWSNRNGSALRWELGAGTLSNWLGGPTRDASGIEDADKGGYAFFETSLLAAPVLRVDDITIREGQNAYLESPVLGSTGAEGKCISFSFSIDGLSASGLRVVLQPVGKDGRPESFFRVLWGSKDPTNKMWMNAEVLYTYNKNHQIVFEGVAKDLPDPYRKYRGYVAVDNIILKTGGECKGHCTFEGGFCGWLNEENDDFDWSLGRGSRNPSTGPATDRSSFIYGGMEGGYTYIDSSYPRRPGDVARLSSAEFEPTSPDTPLCLRFWTHMFGNGVGSLSILISDTRERQDREIWSLSGEAGNAWYQAEVSVSSQNAFKIVLLGKIGKNNLGDIAIDDISLTPGSCPTAPQIAAPGSGDCTFEVDECGWSNVVSRERLDDIDWERSSGQSVRTTARDHTLGTEKGYLMTLARSTVQRPGNRAWFTSRDLKPASGPRCLSFWFIMNEPFIDNSGPSLGALTIYTKKGIENDSPMKPVWRLYNHQGPEWQYAQAPIAEPNDLILIEGIWGSSRSNGFIAFDDITFFGGSCSTLPTGAMVRSAECRFERDMCGWSNGTEKSSASWRLATSARRPANLADKTFGSPDGYIYYDLFNQILGSNMVRLVSPAIAGGEEQQLCLSFWYAAFGAGDSALMQVIRQDNGSSNSQDVEKIWSLEVKNMDTTRPLWLPAQVTVDSSTDFHIVLEGQATNGGFAVDDISFTPGACPTRPEKAEIKSQELQNAPFRNQKGSIK